MGRKQLTGSSPYRQPPPRRRPPGIHPGPLPDRWRLIEPAAALQDRIHHGQEACISNPPGHEPAQPLKIDAREVGPDIQVDHEAISAHQLLQPQDRSVGPEAGAAGVALGHRGAKEDGLHQQRQRPLDHSIGDRCSGNDAALGFSKIQKLKALRAPSTFPYFGDQAGDLVLSTEEEPGDIRPTPLAPACLGDRSIQVIGIAQSWKESPICLHRFVEVKVPTRTFEPAVLPERVGGVGQGEPCRWEWVCSGPALSSATGWGRPARHAEAQPVVPVVGIVPVAVRGAAVASVVVPAPTTIHAPVAAGDPPPEALLFSLLRQPPVILPMALSSPAACRRLFSRSSP